MDTIKRSSLAVGVITRKNDQRQSPMGAVCVAHFSGHAQHTDGVINRFRSSGTVSMSTAEQERYQRYLCSREWSEKKEAVRRRSGGYCERCLVGPMDACHHLTYARKYNEDLADLQAICNGCHEFTHGKTNRGIRATGWTAYLAGKISRNGWRHEFVWGIECANQMIAHGLRLTLRTGAEIAFHYSGPFFSCMGHGQDHGPNTHGAFADNEKTVFSRCVDAVESSDVVFVWIDALDCYGTLVEIGIAHQAGKLVIIGYQEDLDISDLWFAKSSAQFCFPCTNPRVFFGQASEIAVYWLRSRKVA